MTPKGGHMRSAPTPFYATSTEPEEVLQEVRHALSLHPGLLDAPPEQLASVLNLKPAVFEIEAALEALAVEGEVAA